MAHRQHFLFISLSSARGIKTLESSNLVKLGILCKSEGSLLEDAISSNIMNNNDNDKDSPGVSYHFPTEAKKEDMAEVIQDL